MLYDERGRELPDPTPVEKPTGLKLPLSLHDEIRRFVRFELSHQAAVQGVESFEEADDFDVEEEEPELVSPYEVVDLVPEPGDRDASDLRKPEPAPPPAKPVDAGPRKAGDGASAPASTSVSENPP